MSTIQKMKKKLNLLPLFFLSKKETVRPRGCSRERLRNLNDSNFETGLQEWATCALMIFITSATIKVWLLQKNI